MLIDSQSDKSIISNFIEKTAQENTILDANINYMK